MKTYPTIILLSCLWLANCSTKERNYQSRESTTETAIEKPKEGQIFDLDGEVLWAKNGRTIKIINEDKPQVLFTNFKGKKGVSEYQFESIKLVNNETGYLVSGSIKIFGDLNNDGIPEFLIENITENNKEFSGFRMVVSIADTSINILKYVYLKSMQFKCANIVGDKKEVIFEFDSLSEGGPYLIENTRYGYLDSGEEDCNLYEQATIKSYYTLAKDAITLQLVQRNKCPIENNTINLAALYKMSSNQLSRFDYLSFSFDNYYLINNLNECGQPEGSEIINLEQLAGIKLEGGTAIKRTDLMPAIENEFLNVNPLFIAWTRENLIPKPDDKQNNGLTYKFLFDKTKYDFRSYALVRLLIEQEDKEFLLREYSEAKATINNNSPNKDAPGSESGLIWTRLKWVNEQLEKRSLGDIEDFTIYGFWMRRMLDGSEPEIWKTLKYILKMYDGEWYAETNLFGIVEIDSDTYQNASLANINDSVIVSKQSIPEGILVETETDFTITAKNGKVVHFQKTDSNMDMETNYYVSAYWPQKKKIIIGWDDDEQVGYYTIDITSGSKNRLEGKIFPSKEGNYLATFKEELDPSSSEYETITSLKLTKNGQLIEEYTGYFVRDGFWLNDEFYFASNNKRYKVGKLGFDDIRPYSPPIIDTINKTDAITN